MTLSVALSACGGSGDSISESSASDNGDPGSGGSSGTSASSCESTSWIAGTTELCNGHLVYRDYIYDDHGAATFLSPLAPPPYLGNGPGSSAGYISAGAARYPAGADNTADLVRFELWLEDDEVVVEFEINTLFEADQTQVALAIDTDNNPDTGDVKLLGQTVAGADEVHVFTEGDPDSNLFTGRFAKPAGDTWSLWAVTAQSDGTVMNVAFRGTDETAAIGPDAGNPMGKGYQFEDKQAAALMNGDISEFMATVEVARLEAGATEEAPAVTGFHQRVYTSKYTLPPGEGISLDGVPGRRGALLSPCVQTFNFLGKYQPYVIYIPEQPGPHGLQMRLHGCGATPVAEVNQKNYQQRFGEDLNAIIASPLGRGANGFYSDISERDVLDVMEDVIASYVVDEDRVIIGGTSMGGYGSLRLAALYPDRFAAGTNWVGFPGNFFNTPLPDDLQLGPIVDDVNQALGSPIPLQSEVATQGDMMDYTANLKHVPFVHLYAALDELVHVTSSMAYGIRLTETSGIEFDFYQHAPAEHLSFVFFDDWQKESAFVADRTRLRNPAHVVFRTDAYLDYPEYEIKHDKAYWLSDIVAREVGTEPGEAYSDLDVHSLGCGHPEKQFVTGQDGGFGPVPWFRFFSHVVEEVPVPAENRLQAAFINVSSVTIDAEAACLTAGTSYRIETDGPLTIEFTDGRQLVLSEAGTHEGLF